MVGALKAKVNGEWVLASSAAGGGGAEEIYVGTSDPGSSYDLWIDTDESAELSNDMRWNTAWGVVAEATVVANQTVTAGADLNSLTHTFTPVVGRLYAYRVKLDLLTTVAGDIVVLDIRTSTGTQIDRHTGRLGGTASETWAWSSRTESFATTAPVTRKLNLSRASGTGVVAMQATPTFPAKFIIEDVGPVTGSLQAVMPVTDRWNAAWGLQAQAAKSVTEGGFSSTEYVISGLALTAPTVTGRLHRVNFSLRFIPTTLPASANSVITVNLRQGTTIGGTLISNVQFPFSLHSTPYGWNLIGSFPVTSLVSGATYVLTTSTDGTGTYQITNISWSNVEDVGPVSGAAPIVSPTPSWISMGTLQNGWVWYGGVEMPPAYRKVGDMVQIRGTIKNATPSAGATQTFFTLPAGYRPPYTHTLPCMGVDVNDYGCPGIIVVSVGGNMQTVRSSDNQKPHIETLFEFQYSVTP